MTTNTFQVSTTPGGAAVNTSGTQSGTHNLYYAPYGVANSTTFNVPDMRGRTPAGKGSNGLTAALGGNDGVTEANRRGTKHRHTPHTHTVSLGNVTGTPANCADWDNNPQTSINTSSVDGGSGVSTDPLDGGAYLVINYLVKT